MYIIDDTYFSIGKLLIPNINEQTDTSVKTKVNTYIDKNSRLVFKASLGSLYTEFDSHVTDGVLDVGAPLKWQNLVNGTTYTYEGKNYTWNGMLIQEGTSKESLLADYVYYKYMTDNLTVVTDHGRKALSVKTTVDATSEDYLREVWNNFVRKYRGDITDEKRVYRYDCNSSHIKSDKYKDNTVSLITFLKQNEDDYKDAGMSFVIDGEQIKVRNFAGI